MSAVADIVLYKVFCGEHCSLSSVRTRNLLVQSQAQLPVVLRGNALVSPSSHACLFSAAFPWHPQRESNPLLSLERATSRPFDPGGMTWSPGGLNTGNPHGADTERLSHPLPQAEGTRQQRREGESNPTKPPFGDCPLSKRGSLPMLNLSMCMAEGGRVELPSHLSMTVRFRGGWAHQCPDLP